MRAGALDRTITIQRKTLTQDETGAPVESWAVYATVCASKKDLRGSERFASQQVMADADTQFRIRYLSGITPMDRILCEGRTYDVKSVLEFGRREGMDIMAQTRAE
jgi:SPP1 family predicted phage head-tail adaptor